MIAFLAQQMAKDPIARLMRVAWDTVGRIADRVVAERLDGGRLDGPARIGVDEISYAYYPSCAYDGRWACPLTPPANRLAIAVRAGERHVERGEE